MRMFAFNRLPPEEEARKKDGANKGPRFFILNVEEMNVVEEALEVLHRLHRTRTHGSATQATIKTDTGRDLRNHPRVRLERGKPVPWAGNASYARPKPKHD